MLESRLLVERPRLAWPTGVVALSVATFAFLVPLVLGVMSLGELVHSDAALVLVTPLVALIAAAAGRRPLARIAVAAALMGTVAGLLFLRSQAMLAATPLGDEIVPRDLIAATKDSYRRVLDRQEADLALLERGFAAARSGRPLAAPEGGVLIPVTSGTLREYDSRLRYDATNDGSVLPKWEEALREQGEAVAKTRLQATINDHDSPAAWTRRAVLSLAWSLTLALVVSLTAGLSRTLFGALR